MVVTLVPEEPSAMPATRRRIAKLKQAGPQGVRPMPAGSAVPRDASGGEDTEPVSISTSTQTSSTCEMPSSDSKEPWRKPRTVREFAAQANEVATKILNGEIDMEVARSYASLARVVAQSASVEVTRARFLKREPDLSLE